jgi:hypothetical protein
MSDNEDKIKRAFKKKNWHEIKTSDSWKIFKIMSEFVEGFEKLARIGLFLAAPVLNPEQNIINSPKK